MNKEECTDEFTDEQIRKLLQEAVKDLECQDSVYEDIKRKMQEMTTLKEEVRGKKIMG